VDAVVALSAEQRDDGLVAGAGIERLLDALRLARSAGRPLVVTVIHPRLLPAVSSLPDQRALAALAGVGSLYAVDSVHTTHDEAVRVAALAAHQRWRRVAVVTSPLHSARACATFEHAGVRVLCVPAHSRLMTLDGPHALRDGPERLRAFGEWLYERLGWWSYRARGWV
jgi:uncharacterized SAM-binding protein YcdF (DUF218 family)